MKSLRYTLLCLGLLSFPALALDGTEILKKVDRNLEPESSEMLRKLINVEPDGRKKEYVLYSARKGRENVIGLFLAPESDKGRATLRQGDNMWLFIPDVGKPMRITSMQSVTGSIFNNSDILRIDYAEEYAVQSITDDQGQHLLKLKAKTGEVAYDTLKMWVDKKALLPTTIECYAASGMLIKTLHYKNIKDFGGGIKRPETLETDSPLNKGYKSVMIYGQIKKREFTDEVFTLNYLPRVGELRK